MANNAYRYGIRWVRSKYGTGKPNPIRFRVADDYGVGISIGDPVKKLSTGYVDIAAAGGPLYGIVCGIRYFDGTRMRSGDWLPASTSYDTNFERQSTVDVIPAAGSLWELLCDDNATATTEAGYIDLLGNNTDHINPTITINGKVRRGPLLDISLTSGGTATATWRIEEVAQRVDIDFTGLYVPLICSINETDEAPYVTTGQ